MISISFQLLPVKHPNSSILRPHATLTHFTTITMRKALVSNQVYCRDRVRNLANKSVHLVAQVHLVSQVSIQFYILHKLYILVIVPHHFSHHEEIFKFFQICSLKSVLPAPQVCSARWLLVCKLSGVKCLILPSKGEYSSSNTHFTVFFWETKQNK